MEFYQIYHPITAAPFRCNEGYVEVEPCEALRPYIRCFWGTKGPVKQKKTGIVEQYLVIPDTCMDIIFTVDFTENRIGSSFCGLDDFTFYAQNAHDKECVTSTFAIRFYAWSAVAFAEDSMQGTKNGFFDAGQHFEKLKKEIEPLLFDVVTIEERFALVEKVLLKRLGGVRSNPFVMEAVSNILLQKGNIKVSQLLQKIHISDRQLERLFQEYIGVSPKNLTSLIRYQYLWNDIVYKVDFQVQDAVFQYGFTDQAHLLREFKRFHSINISEARQYAMKHVEFLQE